MTTCDNLANRQRVAITQASQRMFSNKKKVTITTLLNDYEDQNTHILQKKYWVHDI